MINWTFDKPSTPGKYLFLHFEESIEPKILDVVEEKGELKGWNSFWGWYEPLYEFSDGSMWSEESINFPKS